VHIEFSRSSPIDYESDWQPWYVELSEDNIPYLHLTGMRFCGMNPDISCEIRDGGGHDFCRDEYIPMNGEGILIILGERSYNLHYPLGSENSWFYGLENP